MRNYFSFLGIASREDYFKFRLLNTCLKAFTLFIIIFFLSKLKKSFIFGSGFTSVEYPNFFYTDPVNRFYNQIYLLAFLILFCIILRLFFSMRLYALTIRRLNDIHISTKWYLIIFTSRQLYLLTWIAFIGLMIYDFIIIFNQIAAAKNITIYVLSSAIYQGLCCLPFFNVEMFNNGGMKMWLYILIYPLGIIYYSTHCIMTILLSSKSKSEQNIFENRKLPSNAKHRLFYLSSLIAEIIYTVFFLSFILINWYTTIDVFNQIAAAKNITPEIISPFMHTFGGFSLEIFFYVTLGIVILNTLFFNIFFRYSKK